MPDILVESFDVDVGASGSTHTLTNDVGSTSSAFVKINNATDKSSGGRTDSTANSGPDDFHVGTALTDTAELTFTKALSNSMKVVGEVWRYTGAASGANEFINRGSYEITVTGTSASVAVSGISNEDNCVPFMTGVYTTEASNSNVEMTTFTVYMDGSGNVVAERNNSGTTCTVYVNVVEFTGSNWSVGHAVSSSHDSSIETVTMNTDSTGTGGSTFDVTDWETAFIEATGGGDSTETGLSDCYFLCYPAGTTTQVVVDYQSGDGNARNDASAYVHVVQNDDLIVKRNGTNQAITEGNGSYGTNIGFPTGTSTARNLNELALEWYVDTNGTGTAHARGRLATRITDATGTIRHWVHRSGNDIIARYGVIDLSQLSAGVTNHDLVTQDISQTLTTDNTTTYHIFEADTISDDFDDNSIDTGKWNAVTSSATPSETSGQLQVTLADSVGGNNYAGYESDEYYTLVNSETFVEFVSGPNTGANGQMMIELLRDNGEWLRFYVQTTFINATTYKIGEGTFNRWSTTYVPATHRWLKIRGTATRVYWDTSSDGISWTNRVNIANPFDTTTFKQRLVAGTYTSTASPGTAVFDNFNITPTITLLTNDISHVLTEGNTAITQNHVISTIDISHGFTEDTTTVDPYGNLNYTYEDETTLGTDDTDLASSFTASEKSNVELDDNTYFDLEASDNAVKLFKYTHDNSTDHIDVTWKGKTTLAPSSSTVYLQIYNHNTTSWETLDSDNTTAVDTEFTLTGSKTTSLSNYYSSNVVTARVYQVVV